MFKENLKTWKVYLNSNSLNHFSIQEQASERKYPISFTSFEVILQRK